jgi:hypothetical protein
MTALGADAPNVVGLVYIAAFGLDEGESIGGLLAQGGPPTPALAHLDIDKQGFAVEVPAGHVAMVSHPDDVAQLIKTAAEAVQTAH